MARYVHWDVLDQTYKLYIRPNLDYDDLIYHSQSFHLISKLESTKYDAALAVSRAWPGTSTDKILKELGRETLAHQRIVSSFVSLMKYCKQQLPGIFENSSPGKQANSL